MGVRDLVALPKAHLHVHLESAVRASTLAELAARYGVVVPGVPKGGFSGFREFADRGSVVRSCLREPEDFARVAREFCADAAADGVRYAEVTFSAGSHGERLGSGDEPLAAVVAGLAEGSAEHDVVTRLILDHSRRRSVGRLAAMVEWASRFPEVVAVGVAGDEAFPLAPFASVLAQARAAGLRMVHHAGEMAGPESVVEAVRVGLADRIGHGIRADASVVAELRERGVAVEVCPSSNVVLGLVAGLGVHPLPGLMAAGVAVSVNLDVPDVVGTSLSGEFGRLRARWGWSDEVVAGLSVAAVEASFAPVGVKERVRGEIAGWLASG
ncbi:Adenine deaminase [Actinokineospora sp. UTMC 2448]|nr:Adenine deaminase [Actinokineospora sp. UTMC 2448]